jgi:hypothetical protein
LLENEDMKKQLHHLFPKSSPVMYNTPYVEEDKSIEDSIQGKGNELYLGLYMTPRQKRVAYDTAHEQEFDANYLLDERAVSPLKSVKTGLYRSRKQGADDYSN